MVTITFEEIPEIKNFLNNKNPTREEIAKAYTIRDEYYNMSLDNIKKEAFDKLLISVNSINKNFECISRRKAIELIDEYMANKKPNSSLDLNEIFSNNTEERIAEIKQAEYRREQFKNTNNIKDFYNECSYEELTILGW